MKLEKIADGIFHVQAETAKELGYSFARPQEYYESARFRGQTFSLKELKDWWVKNTEAGRHAGKFCYCQYWEGFNTPSIAFDPFRQGRFNPLSEQEQALLSLTSHLPSPYYLIGTRPVGKRKQASPETMKHELSHALYFTSPQYKERSSRIIQELGKRNPSVIARLNKFLKEEGYHQEVWQDEQQAYVLAGDDLVDMSPKIALIEVKPEHQALNDLFNQVMKSRK